jgi:class 3 adenylate cyclase/tetratricopeptide (TPR) repeat protein
VHCSVCGSENRVGARFCSECGTAFATTCAECGTPTSPGARFCSNCGTPTPATSNAGVPSAERHGAALAQAALATGVPVAERRLVSILFADLVGSTSLADGRDPEETRELLTRYFDLAREVITRYGGTVEKFIGDAVMAVWGAPIAREDDAERSVRAALDLVDAVRNLGPDMQARAAVLTGEAAVTIGATDQGMVAGDLVNTASRLQGAAAAGTVLVGEATQRVASGAIVFESAGAIALKGKELPVPAWRALRVVARVGGRNRTDALEAPFVGRDDELRMLKDLFHATEREKRPRLVSVLGPAGFGKSRLAWELHKYLDGLLETIWSHDGRSPAYGEGVTFWALGEMVRARAGLIETDDEETTRTKLAETLARHVPDEGERRWIEPALLALLGFGGGIGSEQLFGAWRTFFERLAATAPVVMIFEDLHYADSGTIDFVDHVLEWSRNVPLFIVTLARPELLEKRETWGAGKRHFTSLYLEPLPESAMRELLCGLVPGLPESAVRGIVGRADGIPLYAVETVRMLVAEGRLELRDGGYVPIADLTELAVPETLTALIASRLDGLAAEDRALISSAAVLGQSFTPAALAAVSGTAEAALEPRLRALVRGELLTLDVDPRSPERGQYAFVQALIREVAYNTLARADRKTRHLAAARFFETLDTDELAGALAGHYLAARENAAEGPERGALEAQARIALRGAGERAAALGAHEQAVVFLEQALSATTEPGDRAELLGLAGREAQAAGRHEIAERHLRGALEVRRQIGDRPGIARALADVASALIDSWRSLEAVVVLEAALAEFGDLAEDQGVIRIQSQLARALMLAAQAERAIVVADAALTSAEHADLHELVADTLVTKGTALSHVGRTIEGLGAIAAGQALAEADGLDAVVMRAALNGSSVWVIDHPAKAIAMAREGLGVARRLGNRSYATTLIGNAAEAAVRTGEWSWGVTEVESALEDDIDPVDRVGMLAALVQFRALRGAPAAGLLEEATRLAGTEPEPQMRANLYMGQAFVAMVAGDLREARDAFRAAGRLSPPALAPASQMAARLSVWLGDAEGCAADLATLVVSGFHGRAVEAGIRTSEAGLAALAGRPAEARALYREALEAWRDLGCLWDIALTGIDMATLMDPTDPDARTEAARSRDILVELGATPFVERLDTARARGAPDPAPAATNVESEDRAPV